MATGDVTYSHYANDGSAFASGKIELDVSAISKVYCGFQPSKIVLWIEDADASTYDMVVNWTKGMPAGSMYQAIAAAAWVYASTGGPYVLQDTTGEGFAIPATFHASLVDNDLVYWEAWR